MVSAGQKKKRSSGRAIAVLGSACLSLAASALLFFSSASLAQEARTDDPAEERRLLEEARLAEEEALTAESGIDVPESDVFGAREDTNCFDIENIVVEGVTAFRRGRVQSVIDANSSDCMGQIAIGRLAEAIQNLYTEAGYITTQALIPGQDLSTGTLTLAVVEGVVETMPVNGELTRPAYVSWAFPVREGDILNLRNIERGVDNMNRLSSQNADVQLVAGQEVGGSIVAITVTFDEEAARRDRWGLRTSGVDSEVNGFSYDRGVTLENLMGVNDIWNFSYFGGVGSNGLSASVDVPRGYWDNNFGLTYSEYLQVPNESTEIFGQSLSYSWSSSRQVFRNQRRKISLGWTLRGSEEERFVNGAALTPSVTHNYNLSYNETYVGDYGNWTFNVGLNGGIPNWDAPDDPEDICAGGKRGCFQVSYQSPVLTAGFTRVRPLGQYTTYVTSLRGQTVELPTAYTWNIGGWGSVRGMDRGAPSGDLGLLWQNEWTVRDPFRANPRGCYEDVPQGPDAERPYLRQQNPTCVYRRDGGDLAGDLLAAELAADQSIRAGIGQLSTQEGGSRANPVGSLGGAVEASLQDENQPRLAADELVKQEMARLSELTSQAAAIQEADRDRLRDAGLLSFLDIRQDMETLASSIGQTIQDETGRIVDFSTYLSAVAQAEATAYGDLRTAAFDTVRTELASLRETVAAAFDQTAEEFYLANDTGPPRELPWYANLTMSYTLDIGSTHAWFTNKTDTIAAASVGLSYNAGGSSTTLKVGRGLYTTVDGLGEDWAYSFDYSRNF